MLGGVLLAAAAITRVQQPKPVVEAATDDLRYADEVAVAAERAAATAGRRRDEWAAAQERLDDAWEAFDEADRLARQATKATAFPLISKRRKPGENTARERYLHHAASAAARNRDLSIAQLNDVFAHRGWNPRLHPVVQEAMLRQAVRANRFEEYQKAIETERAAWQEAESAADALRSLRAEAAAAITRTAEGQPAADEQWWAEQWTTGELPAAA
jgi:hypothetical protein